MSAPLPKKEAAPAKEAACSGVRRDITRPTASSQVSVDPQLEITKLWLRCGPKARREFLSDVRVADPDLWQSVATEPAGAFSHE